jgi:hypothetical protein
VLLSLSLHWVDRTSIGYAAHPELMQADDLHPVPAGADYRARLTALAMVSPYA